MAHLLMASFHNVRPAYMLLIAFVSMALAGEWSSAADDGNDHAIVQKACRDALHVLDQGDVSAALNRMTVVADSISPNYVSDDVSVASACAGLHRVLSQKSIEEQYDLLANWMIPVDRPKTLRLLTSRVPIVVPPSEFARLLGERPRPNSFPVSSIGNTRGVFCSGWSLIVAARDSGKLNRLKLELKARADSKVPHAESLLGLAWIAEGERELPKAADLLSRRLAALQAVKAPDPAPFGSDDTILAIAASQNAALRSMAEQILQMLGMLADKFPGGSRTGFVWQTYAASLASRADQTIDVQSNQPVDSAIKGWLPINLNDSDISYSPNACWLKHEGHILRLPAQPGALLFRYPIEGSFEFACEVQMENVPLPTSGLTYQGLGFEVAAQNDELLVISSEGRIREFHHFPCPRSLVEPTFGRMSIRSNADSISLSVNQRPVWSEPKTSNASPWLGLYGANISRTFFRNMKFVGSPVVPSSVSLLDSNDLRGWGRSTRRASVEDGLLFKRYSSLADEPTVNSVWHLADRVLSTTKSDQPVITTDIDRLLSYQRPLLDGETFSYEFFYQPAICEVSPALGRIAFLLQSDGIKIHWISQRAPDWTGLTVDNVLSEPLNRRGPRPLPLLEDAWNRLALKLTDGVATVVLNDVAVYERSIEGSEALRVGFYRHDFKTDSKVRNVQLTGKWPDSFLLEAFETISSSDDEKPSAEQCRRLNTLFDEKLLAANVRATYRKALAMSPVDRYEFLSKWILPGPDHHKFRVSGDFTPLHPAPLARERDSGRSELGSEVISPVFAWLDAARESDRLQECQQRVESAPDVPDEYERRAKTALLLLINMRAHNLTSNEPLWQTMFQLSESSDNGIHGDHWPEILLALGGASEAADEGSYTEFVADLAKKRMLAWQHPNAPRWQNHLASKLHQLREERRANSREQTTLQQWIAASDATANSAGNGNPNVHWSRHDQTVTKTSGHRNDYLFFQQPLDGDFELECDLIQTNQAPLSILAAGSYVGLQPGLGSLETGTYRSAGPLIMLQPVLSDLAKPNRLRLVMRQGIRTVYLNGRNVMASPIPKERDPWIAIRSSARFPSTASKVRILGQPVVLDSVPLSQSTDLSGWLDYYQEGHWTTVQHADVNWIVGQINPAALKGIWLERLLRYQRPLVGDSSVEYEFFYEQGSLETHPALGRLAMILSPNGVREHWITDGRYGPAHVSPNNIADLPQSRKGPAELPFAMNAWNRMVLETHGDTLKLHLNGVLVYERPIELVNQREFGLFHFADLTEARVRNVVLRGGWPKTLIPVVEQELAGNQTNWLDADLPRLKSVFAHDFRKDGLPAKYFESPPPNQAKFSPDGLQIALNAPVQHFTREIIPRFQLSGDFDIEASFSQLQLESRENESGVILRAIFNAPEKPYYDMRRATRPNMRLCQTVVALAEPKKIGGSLISSEEFPGEAVSGRLRLARRGDKLYQLFADSDSATFHQFGVETVSNVETISNGIRLESFANHGSVNVVWNDLKLRAEKMTWHPVHPQTNGAYIKVVQADGTGLTTIASAEAAGYQSVGCPEWSVDGRQVAMDMLKGSYDTAHVIIVNSDGTNFRDLGSGSMPSFSPDGTKLVFAKPGDGIWTMNSDGTDRQPVDREGVGTQWSPDGRWIAYGKSGNVMIMDVATRKSRPLIVGEQANRYSFIYWNLCWSHDSRGLAFKARTRAADRQELAYAAIDAPEEFRVLLQNAVTALPDVCFTPDNDNVIVCMDVGPSNNHKLHSINRKQPGPPERLKIIPNGQATRGSAWSRDGQRLALTVMLVGEPTEWTTEMKSE